MRPLGRVADSGVAIPSQRRKREWQRSDGMSGLAMPGQDSCNHEVRYEVHRSSTRGKGQTGFDTSMTRSGVLNPSHFLDFGTAQCGRYWRRNVEGAIEGW